MKIGNRDLELGSSYLGSLRDANELLGDPTALKARMEEDGYLLLRGLQPVGTVNTTREFLIERLDQNDQIDRSRPLDEARAKEGARGAFLGGSKELTRDAKFLNLVESPEIMGFFADFLQAKPLTYSFKWLRVVAPGGFTGSHYDIVYMGRGTQNVYTCWTPIGDVNYDMGPLSILVGSHRGPGFERVRETYGKMDVDRDKVGGWFSNDPIEMVDKFGGQWQTTEFRSGDVLIFGMYTMHCSLTNVTDRFRLTCDTRYQRADDPADERWIGENPMAHSSLSPQETVSMEAMREKWKV